MGHYSFKTPDVGEGIVEVELIKWAVGIGDQVEEDQHIADVMTDKANIELTAPVAGRVERLGCEAGEMINVGAELIRLETGEAEEEPEESVQKSATPPAQTPAGAPVSTPAPATPARVHASPAVRRRAKALGIDLAHVPTLDPAGRVRHEDLDSYRFARTPDPTTPTPDTPTTDTTVQHSGGETEQITLSGLRRVIAQRMEASANTIPHFSYVEEIDLTELEKLRQHLNQEQTRSRNRLTLLPFIIRAMISTLHRFPDVNATYDDAQGVITRHASVHMGVATMTPQGLKVPVIRDAQRHDIWTLAEKIDRLANRARDNSIGADELSGSTLSVTSLGRLGGIAATPILNKPEVAIIGVNKACERVMVEQGRMEIRYMMNLSSSFDHRIIDGQVAAAYIQSVKQRLEHPATLFMAPDP